MKDNFDPFAIDVVEVVVTYPEIVAGGLTCKFFLTPETLKEDLEHRQRFLGMTDEERDEKAHDYRVDRLAALSVKPPEVPGLVCGGDNFRETMHEFFSGTNPLKRRVVMDALIRYETVTSPQEFFRGV